MRKLAIVLLLGLAASSAAGQTVPLAEQARKLWEAASSQFGASRWSGAQPLLEKFVKDFPTHENVPLAYVRIGHCRLKQKNVAGFNEAMDEVIKRFYGSSQWLAAYGYKLSQSKGDAQLYVTTIENLLKKTGEAPAYLPLGYDDSRLHWNLAEPDIALYGLGLNTNSWVMDLAQIARTPELAERALKALAKTIEQRKHDLSLDWQFAHVLLTAQSGDEQASQKLWQDYLADLQGNPIAAGLLVLRAERAQALKQDDVASETWRQIVKEHAGSGWLHEHVHARLQYLKKLDRFKDYMDLLGGFYPKDQYRVQEYVRDIVQMAASHPQDAERMTIALAAIDGFPSKGHLIRQRQQLLWKIDLKLAQKQPADAAKLAEELIIEQQWCAESYDSVKTWASSHEAFKPVVEAARKKWSITPADPSNAAGQLLAQLKTRLKDDEIRHAEEIGEQLFNEQTTDGSTIEAIQLLIGYYYSKVLAEPRDKWLERLIQSYPYHPITQAVLYTQVNVELAAKRYDRLAKTIDTLLSHFPPTIGNTALYEHRMTAFGAVQDAAGAAEFAKKFIGPMADVGDMWAAQSLMQRVHPAAQARGDAWMALAQKLEGTRDGLSCTLLAWKTYCAGGKWTYWDSPKNIIWEPAKRVVTLLASQTQDPALAWQVQFMNVNLAAFHGEAKAALAAMNEQIKDKEKDKSKFRDLSQRVDLLSLGRTLAAAGLIRETDDLGRKLTQVCFTDRDQDAIEVMLATAHEQVNDFNGAGEHYIKIVRNCNYPVLRHNYMMAALECFRKGRSPKLASELEHYLTDLASAQDTVPPMLAYQAKNVPSMAAAAYKSLQSRFPVSQSLQELNQLQDAARKPPGAKKS